MAALPPELSVVVPTYRQPELLEALLDSLAAQEVPEGGAEIIVVDDGSPEWDAAERRRPAAGRLPLHWLHHPRNLGRAQARNSGLDRARGRRIVFLDGDMLVAPGFLRAHAAFHQLHPGQVAVGAIRFAPGLPRTAVSRYLESRGAQAHPPGAEIPFKCFATGNASLGRADLDRVGRFDAAFQAYGGEDLELGYRLHRAGLSFRFLAGALCYHRHLRPLDDLLDLMETYGRTGLPYLLARHPDLRGLLRLDFLARSGPRSALLRLALSPWLYRGVRAAVRALAWAPLPSILLSYLWWSSRTRGYLAAVPGPAPVAP